MPKVRTVFSRHYAVAFLFVALAVFEYKESDNFGVSGGLFFMIFCFWVIKDFVSAAKRTARTNVSCRHSKKKSVIVYRVKSKNHFTFLIQHLLG